MEKIYRHGDVILVRVVKVPDGTATTHNSYIVEHGESGHLHEIVNDNQAIKVIVSDDMRRYLELSDTCQLRHDEHATLQIEPGMYEILKEQEYDYIEHEMRKVVD